MAPPHFKRRRFIVIKRKYKITFKVGGGITRVFRIKCAQAELPERIRPLGQMLEEDYDNVQCVGADEFEQKTARNPLS